MGFLRKQKRSPLIRKKTFLLGGGSAALMYFFDPQSGRSRRARFQDRIGALVRQGARRAETRRAYQAGRAQGAEARAAGAGSGAVPENDPALVAKVESEVFQGTDFPKGRININAENGVVVLRGELDSQDQIDGFERAVRNVMGVVEVENLLHLPGQAPPHKREVQQIGGR